VGADWYRDNNFATDGNHFNRIIFEVLCLGFPCYFVLADSLHDRNGESTTPSFELIRIVLCCRSPPGMDVLCFQEICSRMWPY